MRPGVVGSVVGVWLALCGTTSAQGTGEPPPMDLVPAVQSLNSQPGTAEILLTQGAAGTTSAGQPGAGGGPGGGAGGGQQDNGTNPAQNVTTFITSNEYYTLDGGNRINTTYARFKFPIYGQRGSILFEMPYVYYNLKASFPNAPQIGGLGDVKVQASFNTWMSPDKKLTVINFLEIFLPTADNALVASPLPARSLTAFNLGTGKYVFGPGLGLVYAFAPNFIVAPLYFYEASAFGNSDRPDIRRGKFRLFAMYAWESGVYMLPEFQALTNYRTGDTDFYAAPEVGYSHKRTILYVKPGFGIDPKPGDRQWGLEVGARVQF